MLLSLIKINKAISGSLLSIDGLCPQFFLILSTIASLILSVAMLEFVNKFVFNLTLSFKIEGDDRITRTITSLKF